MSVDILAHYEDMVNKVGGFSPALHDSEIIAVQLSRSVTHKWVDITLSLKLPGGPRFAIRFEDIEDLKLYDFQYQNVVHSLIITEISQKRFMTGVVETRRFVAIDSVFGATCSFSTCGGSFLEG